MASRRRARLVGVHYLIRLCVKMSNRVSEARGVHASALDCNAPADEVSLAWDQYMRVRRECLDLSWVADEVNDSRSASEAAIAEYIPRRWRGLMDRFAASGD